MKLNLGSGFDFRVGYVNIDISDKFHSKTLVGDAKDLSKLDIPDNSIDEIIAIHLIQHFTPDELQLAINNWYTKLQPGGSITIKAFDYSVLGNTIMYERIDLINLNKILFGDANNIYRGIFNLVNLVSLLESTGMKITNKGYQGLEFDITAIK